MNLREKLFGKPLPNYAWRMGCVPRAILFVVGMFTIPPVAYVAWVVALAIIALSLIRIAG